MMGLEPTAFCMASSLSGGLGVENPGPKRDRAGYAKVISGTFDPTYGPTGGPA